MQPKTQGENRLWYPNFELDDVVVCLDCLGTLQHLCKTITQLHGSHALGRRPPGGSLFSGAVAQEGQNFPPSAQSMADLCGSQGWKLERWGQM